MNTPVEAFAAFQMKNSFLKSTASSLANGWLGEQREKEEKGKAGGSRQVKAATLCNIQLQQVKKG